MKKEIEYKISGETDLDKIINYIDMFKGDIGSLRRGQVVVLGMIVYKINALINDGAVKSMDDIRSYIGRKGVLKDEVLNRSDRMSYSSFNQTISELRKKDILDIYNIPFNKAPLSTILKPIMPLRKDSKLIISFGN